MRWILVIFVHDFLLFLLAIWIQHEADCAVSSSLADSWFYAVPVDGGGVPISWTCFFRADFVVMFCGHSVCPRGAILGCLWSPVNVCGVAGEVFVLEFVVEGDADVEESIHREVWAGDC
jgi:hypothetical protein